VSAKTAKKPDCNEMMRHRPGGMPLLGHGLTSDREAPGRSSCLDWACWLHGGRRPHWSGAFLDSILRIEALAPPVVELFAVVRSSSWDRSRLRSVPSRSKMANLVSYVFKTTEQHLPRGVGLPRAWARSGAPSSHQTEPPPPSASFSARRESQPQAGFHRAPVAELLRGSASASPFGRPRPFFGF
jgi:hypothetical protein